MILVLALNTFILAWRMAEWEKQFLAENVGTAVAGSRQQLKADMGGRTATAAAVQAAAPALVLPPLRRLRRFKMANPDPLIDPTQPTDHPIPALFAWPSSNVGDMFVLWECGDGSLDIGPHKYIHPCYEVTNAKNRCSRGSPSA